MRSSLFCAIASRAFRTFTTHTRLNQRIRSTHVAFSNSQLFFLCLDYVATNAKLIRHHLLFPPAALTQARNNWVSTSYFVLEAVAGVGITLIVVLLMLFRRKEIREVRSDWYIWTCWENMFERGTLTSIGPYEANKI